MTRPRPPRLPGPARTRSTGGGRTAARPRPWPSSGKGRGEVRRPSATKSPNRRRPRPRTFRRGSPTRRLRVGFVAIAILMSIFAGRLFELQGFEASAYATRAAKERLATRTLQAERGDITDRSGVVLATTIESVAVTADPVLTRPYADRIAGILGPILHVSESDLRKRLTKPDSRFVYLARKVYPDVWETASKQLKKAGLPGVFAAPDPTRTYPAGQAASNIVGFVRDDGTGGGGLEYALDDILTGKPGKSTYERGTGGRQIPLAESAEQEAVPGVDVQLTIDRDVQWVAQQAIAEQVRETGAESGDVVVLDVKTGEIVALATAPGFDPNDLESATPFELRNRPLQDVYEPGSVAKVLTAAALIDSGHVASDTKITVPGRLRRGGEWIKDYWEHGDLPLTFAGAIAKSSNVGTVLAVESMPKQQQAEYLEKFGIGVPTGLKFPGESKGILAPPEDWGSLQRATISFGQGLAVNAVQMASALAAIANDGVRVSPSLISESTKVDGRPLRPTPDRTRVVSKQAADEVTAMMEAVTAPDGVAPAAAIPDYRVAGKTGTAQRVDPECSCYRGYTTSFGGFAPAEDPRFVTYVVLHDPQGDATGSSTAAPVFSEVMSFALRKYSVEPSGSEPPAVPLTW